MIKIRKGSAEYWRDKIYKKTVTVKSGAKKYTRTAFIGHHAWHNAGTKISESGKNIRRAVGLPLTKQLVYKKKENGMWIERPITRFRFAEIWTILNDWFVMEIEVLDIDTKHTESILIHSDYLAEMQSSSFTS